MQRPRLHDGTASAMQPRHSAYKTSGAPTNGHRTRTKEDHMGSVWGEKLNISIFGESHGPGIGVVIDGLPSGCPIDLEAIDTFMERRAPGRTPWSTKRVESDKPEVLSGLFRGQTTGTPLAAIIRNRDTRSQDYSGLNIRPRPGHADLTGAMRYNGANDPRGGGHFSGRLTAPLTFAGALASQILKQHGTTVAARILAIAGIHDCSIDTVAPDFDALAGIRHKTFPVLSDDKAQQMIDAVEAARVDLDSVGGIVEAIAWGFPAGIGDPMFGGIEPRLASLLFGIPAVKAVEFGDGFEVCGRRGSTNNDSPVFITENGKQKLRMKTNHSGGIDGGITTGMPIVLRVGIKPTSSISKEQDTVDLNERDNVRLVVKGRHDPCIVPRAVPVVEGALALGLLDRLLSEGHLR